MTRDVICYVTNNTNYEYYATINLTHGKQSPKAPQPVTPNQNQGLAFSLSKTTGSLHGVTGSVSYVLNDGSTLFIGFNCPYSQDGTGIGYSNCWAYAGLTTVPQYGTGYSLDCSVNIDGASMDPSNPPGGETVTIYITINQN